MRFATFLLSTTLLVDQTTAAHNVRSSATARRRLQCDPDTESPTASCEDAFDLNVGVTVTVGDIDMGSGDACDTSAAPTLVGDPLVGTCELFNAGDPIDVEITIMDAEGNSASCDTPVTVVDQNAPTAICQDTTVALSGSGSASIAASDIDNGSSDACTDVSLSVAPMAFTCGEIGSNTVTLTATDTSMNADTCTAEVTVTEDIPPVLTCPVDGQTINLDAGTNTVTVDFGATATDNCDMDVAIAPTQEVYGCADVGEVSATIEATDDSGNSAECTITNTIRDDEDPTIVCTTDTITKTLMAIDADVTLAEVVTSTSDNCNSLTTVFESSGADSILYTCADVGTKSEKVTTTDASSNTAECTVTIEVVDGQGPDADCMFATVEVDASGVAAITVADVDRGSDDNCGIASLELSTTSAGCSDIGTPVEVFLTATDTAGLTTACRAEVSVVDQVAPAVTTCNDVTLALGSSSTATLDASSFAATDNCGGAVTTTLSKTTFACGETGPITVTFTDVYSNQATCTPTINVDACPPTPPPTGPPEPTDVPCGVSDIVCVIFDLICAITFGLVCLR